MPQYLVGMGLEKVRVAVLDLLDIGPAGLGIA